MARTLRRCETDDSNVQRVSIKHYVSIQTLCRMREKVYKRW